MPLVTAIQVQNAVGNARTRVGVTKYFLETTSTGIKLTDAYGEQLGSVRCFEEHGKLQVETINVTSLYKGQGLGKLLLAALLELATQRGITRLGLSTMDTSGGFWAHYGVGMGGGTAIATISGQVWNIGTINVT
jgi:GNAT superfamily N-acetyltransferase